ncbi:uncharacterized protein B0I36DRAFT_360450 [Microdochium trichocladiopsis]|uniref:RRM domain-containing protein n=1 Tax=Microdochium trichocladiopsis TaxID=1682393 RepID=A0A9P8YDD9_9PEZI|nr:uncharacterized protein B0I36DRAFT_360450 [Microdochium trichocladiopsis]KAH7034998.1 hypothetical protein B0I36DRAFT_360450 [Microdochium trichocladiopsis]
MSPAAKTPIHVYPHAQYIAKLDILVLTFLPPIRILFVKNLNYDVDSKALWTLFDPNQERIVRQIRQGISVDSRGTAYVVFWNVMDAKNALDKLNGFNFQNRYLVVLWHQPEKTLRSKTDEISMRREQLAQLKQQHGID